MSTRLILIEVADVQTQDDISMAIHIWNDQKRRPIKIIQQTSLIIGKD